MKGDNNEISPIPTPAHDLMTEQELVQFLRIPEISSSSDLAHLSVMGGEQHLVAVTAVRQGKERFFRNADRQNEDTGPSRNRSCRAYRSGCDIQ